MKPISKLQRALDAVRSVLTKIGDEPHREALVFCLAKAEDALVKAITQMRKQ